MSSAVRPHRVEGGDDVDIRAESDADVDMEDSDEGARQGGASTSTAAGTGRSSSLGVSISPSATKQLCAELLKARAIGYLHMVPIPVLKALLGALHRQMMGGNRKTLADDEDVSVVALLWGEELGAVGLMELI